MKQKLIAAINLLTSQGMLSVDESTAMLAKLKPHSFKVAPPRRAYDFAPTTGMFSGPPENDQPGTIYGVAKALGVTHGRLLGALVTRNVLIKAPDYIETGHFILAPDFAELAHPDRGPDANPRVWFHRTRGWLTANGWG